jgi:hypothetical protein
MTDVEGQHGPWKLWSEYPAGPDKDLLNQLWEHATEAEAAPGDERRYWAIQIKGKNPITGYRIRRNPLEPTTDPD